MLTDPKNIRPWSPTRCATGAGQSRLLGELEALGRKRGSVWAFKAAGGLPEFPGIPGVEFAIQAALDAGPVSGKLRLTTSA